MPVSTCFAGSSESLPPASRLYWMKTRFQISMKRAQPPFTSQRCATSCLSQAAGPRSMWISEHGPQGPVSPISQKFSSSKRLTRSRPMSVTSSQSAAASSSVV